MVCLQFAGRVTVCECGNADSSRGVATFKKGGTPMGRDGLRLVRS